MSESQSMSPYPGSGRRPLNQADLRKALPYFGLVGEHWTEMMLMAIDRDLELYLAARTRWRAAEAMVYQLMFDGRATEPESVSDAHASGDDAFGAMPTPLMAVHRGRRGDEPSR